MNPSLVPVSCEACGKVDPDENVLFAFSIMHQYPGLVRHETLTRSDRRGRYRQVCLSCLQYDQARWLADRLGIDDDLFFVQLLDAALKGLNHGR